MDRKFTTTIIVDRSLYLRIRTKLLKIGKSFSKWINEKIKEDLDK